MAALVNLLDVRALVATDADDATLLSLVQREEAALVARCGAHGDGAATITETLDGGDGVLFLSRSVASITSVSEATQLGASAAPLAASQYSLAAGGMLIRLSEGRRWGRTVVVTYVPASDLAARKQALIDLVRLTVNRTAMKGESVGGEYSYTAPDWEDERAAVYRRLIPQSL